MTNRVSCLLTQIKGNFRGMKKPQRIENEAVLKQRRSESCWVCGRQGADASHIKTRGSGGPDEFWNVVAKCRTHHVEWGYGSIKFLKKYPNFALRLKLLGWEWESGKLIHPNLSKGS